MTAPSPAAPAVETDGRPRVGLLDRARHAAWLGILLTIGAGVVYWLSNRFFDAGRGDLFYLADAFLHGRTWLDVRLGPQDVIIQDGHIYVPFAPFPAMALMPLVAITGPEIADQWETGINAALAAATVGLAWWFTGRAHVRNLVDRFLLAVLLGFSTQIWWVTTRGGVWHTGQLDRDDPDPRDPHRAVGEAAGLADRPPRRRRVPHPGAARLRDPVLRPAPRRRRPVGAAALAVGAAGSS